MSGNIAPRVLRVPGNKMSPLSMDQTPKITKIVTSKEWVLPPRPKPGRKPSVDTPSTKRKAQNRALQRLFRERRLNRVSELEDKILEIEKERSIKEGLLNNHIKNLSIENKRLNEIIQELRNQQKPGKIRDDSKSSKYISPISSAANSPNVVNVVNNDDCGVCLKDDCICESIGLRRENAVKKDGFKRDIESFKPMALVPLKRKLSEPLELDFTNKFKPKKMPQLVKQEVTSNQGDLFVAGQRSALKIQPVIQQQLPLIKVVEEDQDCGFCSDDTPCICRELAKEVENMNKLNDMLNQTLETNLPPLKNVSRQNSLPVLHPGPTVALSKDQQNQKQKESTSSLSSTPLSLSGSSTSSQCTGNPGTCSQCQVDPMSTLFCTSILSKKEEQEKQQQQQQGNNTAFISTADAYKTLSRHENFNMVNFNTLIGKLTTRGMLVEVGSVASVLRELDRKFSGGQ